MEGELANLRPTEADLASRSTETHTIRIAAQKDGRDYRYYFVREAGVGRTKIYCMHDNGNTFALSNTFGDDTAKVLFALEDADTAAKVLAVVAEHVPNVWIHSAPRVARA